MKLPQSSIEQAISYAQLKGKTSIGLRFIEEIPLAESIDVALQVKRMGYFCAIQDFGIEVSILSCKNTM